MEKENEKKVIGDVRQEQAKLGELEMKFYACDCAEHLVAFYEKRHPADKRLRESIEAARQYVRGQIERSELREKVSRAVAAAEVEKMEFGFRYRSNPRLEAWAATIIVRTVMDIMDDCRRIKALDLFWDRYDIGKNSDQAWEDEAQWRKEKLMEYSKEA